MQIYLVRGRRKTGQTHPLQRRLINNKTPETDFVNPFLDNFGYDFMGASPIDLWGFPPAHPVRWQFCKVAKMKGPPDGGPWNAK